MGISVIESKTFTLRFHWSDYRLRGFGKRVERIRMEKKRKMKKAKIAARQKAHREYKRKRDETEKLVRDLQEELKRARKEVEALRKEGAHEMDVANTMLCINSI